MTKPVAKSLHTVTVLVQVARLIRTETPVTSVEEALDKAVRVLGLNDREDPWNTRVQALKQLQA